MLSLLFFLWGLTNINACIPAYMTVQGMQIPVWQRQVEVQSGYLTAQMLDTFDNHIQAQSDSNITIAVMDIFNYSILQADVRYGLNQPYNTIAFYNGTNINFWFNQSEDCSAYLYVVYNNEHRRLEGFNLTMNATAVHNSINHLTGICAT